MPTSSAPAVHPKARTLRFQQPPDPILRHLAALQRGRPLRPRYDPVHIAIAQALDELRGTPAPVRLEVLEVFREVWTLPPTAQAWVANFALWVHRRWHDPEPEPFGNCPAPFTLRERPLLVLHRCRDIAPEVLSMVGELAQWLKAIGVVSERDVERAWRRMRREANRQATRRRSATEIPGLE
jgi:hypothetical protein